MSFITDVNVMRLAELDLNLLRAFDALMRERRVSPAAEQLGLSQPALSNALARLRRRLDDPLFVRSPAGLQPTPRAEQLAGPVREALALLAGALERPAAFDPRLSRRRFHVAMSDIGEIYFLPTLMQALRDAAPGLSIATVRPGTLPVADALENGSLDLAIGHLAPVRRSGAFHQRRLFDQRYVCLLRAGHPLLNEGAPGRRARGRATTTQGISLDAFQAAEHLLVQAAGTAHGQVDEALRRQGIERRVALTVPHFVATGHLLAATDLVATVPQRLAERMTGPFGLVALPHPARLPRSPISMVWPARLHRDEASRWLRATVLRLFAQPEGDGPEA